MDATGSAFGPGDPKQERMIAVRRAMEAERLQRIKDPKSRIMGIDTNALDAQVAEKRAAAEAEQALEGAYDQQRLQQDAQLAYIEQERLRAERQKAAYLAQFNATQLGKEKSREYDLNDPRAKLIDLPARTGDDDARLSVSGMQQFHGEDLSYAQRVKVQQAELRAWCDDAVAAKRAAEAKERAMDDAFATRALQVDQMKTDLEATAKVGRAHTNVAVAEYNLAMAAAKRERELAAQKADLQDNVEEIQNQLRSDVLTENPLVGRSFLAPNRLRPDHYKGMAPEELAAIAATQELQRQQAAAAKATEKAEDLAADAMMEAARKAGAYQDAQVATMRAEMKAKLMDENAALAKQQFAAKSFLTTNVFTNAIDASFFDQFGTTSR